MKSMSGFGGGVASLSMKSAASGEQYSGLISNGLEVLLDAGNSSSYSGSGSTITNIAPSGTPFGNATIKQGTYTANTQGAAGFQNLRAYIVDLEQLHIQHLLIIVGSTFKVTVVTTQY